MNEAALQSGEGHIIAALNTFFFLLNARHCGDGIARNYGYARMEKLTRAVFNELSCFEDCS